MTREERLEKALRTAVDDLNRCGWWLRDCKLPLLAEDIFATEKDLRAVLSDRPGYDWRDPCGDPTCCPPAPRPSEAPAPPCPRCGGNGWVEVTVTGTEYDPDGNPIPVPELGQERCEDCGGTGRTPALGREP